MRLLDENKQSFFAVTECELVTFRGSVVLAIHNSIQSQITLTLDPDRWAVSDPLTGCEMFRGKKGDAKEDLIRQVRNVAIPTMEVQCRIPFPELVAARRSNLEPAMHPQKVVLKTTLARV